MEESRSTVERVRHMMLQLEPRKSEEELARHYLQVENWELHRMSLRYPHLMNWESLDAEGLSILESMAKYLVTKKTINR